MEYSPETLRRFGQAGGGTEPPGDTRGTWVAGEAEDRTLQVWVRFELNVHEGRVEAVRFRVFGCPHTIAAASYAADEIAGQPAEFLGRLDVRAWGRALDVPVEKLGKLLRIEDALIACRRAASA